MSHLGARLPAYVDGELSRETRALVESHLATCPACRAELADEIKLKEGLAALPTPEPSAGFMNSLLDIAGPGGAGAPRGRPLAGAGAPGGGRPGRAEFTPTSPGLRPAVPGGPAPDPNSGARRRSMAAAGVVSVAAVTLGAALFGGEATSPRPETREILDLSAVRNATTSTVPTDVADVPAGALAGGLAAAGSRSSGLEGWTFGIPGFGLAGFGHSGAADPADPFFGWLRLAEADPVPMLGEGGPFGGFLRGPEAAGPVAVGAGAAGR